MTSGHTIRRIVGLTEGTACLSQSNNLRHTYHMTILYIDLWLMVFVWLLNGINGKDTMTSSPQSKA